MFMYFSDSFVLNHFVYLFLAVLGLHCCAWAFSSCGEWGLLFLAVVGFLTAVTSLVAERAQALGVQTSAVVAHGLSCSMACGTVPDQGSNQCPLHCKVNS